MLQSIAMLNPETMMVVFVVVLLLFGGQKMPELMRGVGQGIGELKKGLEEGKSQLLTLAEPPAPKADQANVAERTDHPA